MQQTCLKVLLIEDNAGEAYMLKAMLSGANGHLFEVEWAESLEAGLHFLSKGEYDSVLLDLSLPDSNGLDTLAKLSSEALSIPILILTDKEDEEIGRKAVQDGAQDYLLKSGLSSDFLRQSIVYGIERQKLVEKIRSESIQDELTKLYNRRGFLTLIEQQLKVISRNKRPASLLFIDLDNLKTVNDEHGHAYGDMALIEVARTLKSIFRDSDIVARMGGDEFAVFALGADSKTAETLAQRLREHLEEKNNERGRMYYLAVSVGIASYSTDSEYDVKELLSLADALMYKHKTGKKEGETDTASVCQQLV